jgi:ribosomal protein L18E
MKDRGLISPEARYVKVLGGGIIDKPLVVYANSFSLSAAKMIALTGGQAVKVRTQRYRRIK